VAIGLAAGIAGALGFGRLIESRLWGITATDPPTFAIAAGVLVVVTAQACVGPIRRAFRIDPAAALRAE
jgi:ABC-type antimicrobial peptide transport system permease subunit